MGGARALIASLGASISLVAGAAVSLLFFSFVFALPGLTGGDDAPAARAAVVVASPSSPARTGRAARSHEASDAVVIRASKPTRAAVRPAARNASGQRRQAAAAKPSFDPRLPDLTPSAPARANSAPATSKTGIGKGVRDVGDAVTATVHGTGEATAPLLGPPVAQAIQDVLDLLTSVLQGATTAVGGVLDKTVPR